MESLEGSGLVDDLEDGGGGGGGGGSGGDALELSCEERPCLVTQK